MPKKASYFLVSERSKELMDCINRNLGSCSRSELYRKLKAIDPKIPGEASFAKFVKTIEQRRNTHALAVLDQISNITGENDGDDAILKQLFNAITGKLLGLGDAVLRQEVEEVKRMMEAGQTIPLAQRERVMRWLWSGLKTKADAQIVDLRVNADERAETIFDNLFKSAQYGKVNREVIEGEVIKA